MSKQLFFSAPVVVAAMLIASCAPRMPFTQEVRDQYKLTDDELKSIQFYTSSDIVLYRDVTDKSEVGTDRGTLKIKSGRTVEEVVIPNGTPCIVQSVMDNRKLVLGFGDGPSEFLVFGDISETGIRFRRGHYYAMLAAEFREGRDVVEYDGKEFFVADPGHPVYLMFKMTSIREFEKSSKVVKGKKL